MTNDIRESSRTRGEPVSLYLFRGAVWTPEMAEKFGFDPGTFGPYAFTNAEQPITRIEEGFEDPVTYEPWTITRGGIVQSGSLDKTKLDVSMAEGTELAQQFLEYPPNQVVNLFIRDGHIGDDPNDPNSFLVVWSGRVLGAAHPPGQTKFTCEPIATSMRRPGLRRNYQINCPLVLYGPQCRASRSAATITRTVAAVGRGTITLPPGWDSVKPYGKYIGGMIGWTRPDGAEELRTILRCADGVTLKVTGVVRGLSAGQSVRVILGCNHSVARSSGVLVGDCISLHNNIHNYGGQPFIPLANPIGGVNQFN